MWGSWEGRTNGYEIIAGGRTEFKGVGVGKTRGWKKKSAAQKENFQYGENRDYRPLTENCLKTHRRLNNHKGGTKNAESLTGYDLKNQSVAAFSERRPQHEGGLQKTNPRGTHESKKSHKPRCVIKSSWKKKNPKPSIKGSRNEAPRGLQGSAKNQPRELGGQHRQ